MVLVPSEMFKSYPEESTRKMVQLGGTYRVAGVDVGVGLEVLEDLLEVATSRGPEKTGVVIRLKKRKVKFIVWVTISFHKFP